MKHGDYICSIAAYKPVLNLHAVVFTPRSCMPSICSRLSTLLVTGALNTYVRRCGSCSCFGYWMQPSDLAELQTVPQCQVDIKLCLACTQRPCPELPCESLASGKGICSTILPASVSHADECPCRESCRALVMCHPMLCMKCCPPASPCVPAGLWNPIASHIFDCWDLQELHADWS